MRLYRIVRTDSLPPGRDAAMAEDGKRAVIYVRASLPPQRQREAVRAVLRAARRRAGAGAAAVFGALTRRGHRAAVATCAAVVVGVAVLAGAHLGAPAQAHPAPAASGTRATPQLGAAPARPPAHRDGHPKAGHPGTTAAGTPAPAARASPGAAVPTPALPTVTLPTLPPVPSPSPPTLTPLPAPPTTIPTPARRCVRVLGARRCA